MFFETLENRSLFSVSLAAGVLTVTGTNLADAITINKNASGQLTVNDNGTPHAYGWGSVSQIIVNALAGNDTVTSYDTVTKPMVVHGGDGNDHIRTGGSADVITGDAGNDWIDGGALNDDMYGGAGIDTVSYADRTFGVVVTLDDVANDGKPVAGPKDNCHSDIENVIGTNYADTITGSSVNNYLSGLGGNDNLYGNGGTADVLDGGAGNDYLSLGTGNGTANGGDGNDVVVGGTGAGTNYLYGDADNDSIYGYGNQNIMCGGVGDDYLNSYATGTSYIWGGDGNDTALGGYGANVIWGEAGNDTLYGWSANSNSVYGGPGDDKIWGGGGANYLYGDDGNDQVHGAGTGTNWVYGGAGNDKVWGGGSGTNYVHGDAGNDQLFGGPGVDYMNGGDGDDVLVSVGGGHSDVLNGDAGFDSFWADSEASEQVSTTDGFWDKLFEGAAGNVHRVASFYGGVSRELLGQNLTDPSDSGYTHNFSDQPLFSSAGPSKDDVYQGNVGDCWLVASFSSVAKTDPNRIRQSVVELGDGTYAVDFKTPSGDCFMRVDADLPVWSSGSSSLEYAKQGQGGSMWVAIMEKAWAFFRTGAGTYASLNGGWMDQPYNAFGGTGNTFHAPGSSATDLLNYIQGELSAGKAVTIGTGTVAAGCPCVGGHAYLVDHVNFQTINLGIFSITIPVSVTLRNPWGYDGAGSDSNTSDGYVTVTGEQLRLSIQGVQSAFV